jgi:CRP-like cAMP-binding protein
VETVDATALRDAVRPGPLQRPDLARACALSEAFYEDLLLEHLQRLSCLSAQQRVGHLILELRDRLRLAGLGDLRRFDLPLTQESVADHLGLSVVHVNRMLQQLRRDGLLKLSAGQAILPDPDALAAECGYLPLLRPKDAIASPPAAEYRSFRRAEHLIPS